MLSEPRAVPNNAEPRARSSPPRTRPRSSPSTLGPEKLSEDVLEISRKPSNSTTDGDEMDDDHSYDGRR
ncbi:hypothetical protein U9M48_002140 [Paspalum notatum var. saurae]|uniref:Uncharacterized protein n=1 Tax=Paspalum notatum var. saurae TaxID=547442 RepID=A0AAQ3PHB6_PASNO